MNWTMRNKMSSYHSVNFVVVVALQKFIKGTNCMNILKKPSKLSKNVWFLPFITWICYLQMHEIMPSFRSSINIWLSTTFIQFEESCLLWWVLSFNTQNSSKIKYMPTWVLKEIHLFGIAPWTELHCDNLQWNIDILILFTQLTYGQHQWLTREGWPSNSRASVYSKQKRLDAIIVESQIKHVFAVHN